MRVFRRINYQIATPGIAATAKCGSVFKYQRFSEHAPLTVDEVPGHVTPGWNDLLPVLPFRLASDLKQFRQEHFGRAVVFFLKCRVVRIGGL